MFATRYFSNVRVNYSLVFLWFLPFLSIVLTNMTFKHQWAYSDIFFLISDILLECRYGYYGERCSNECGHCLNNTACHHVTGTCVNGCEPGYKAPNCTKGIIYFFIKNLKKKNI